MTQPVKRTQSGLPTFHWHVSSVSLCKAHFPLLEISLMPLCGLTKATTIVLSEWDYIFSFKQRQLLQRLDVSDDGSGLYTFINTKGSSCHICML